MFRESFWGFDGFEELRKVVRQGSEISKELSVVLQERSDVELTYAKSLSKIAAKLLKVCGNGLGSLVEGWKSVGLAMEQEADVHKILGTGLLEDINKPLRNFVEVQIKARKPLEAAVERAYKNLQDKRVEELKLKKQSYACCRDHEKAEAAISEAKAGKGKDIGRLEKKSQLLHTALKKADKDYIEACYKAESARQDWELMVAKSSLSMQDLEEERMQTLLDYLSRYHGLVFDVPAKLTQYFDNLQKVIGSVDPQQDLALIVQTRGMKDPPQPEQVLVDSYAEDVQVAMDSERRKDALKNYLYQLHQYIDRERKGKEGVEKLIGIYTSTPSFAGAETQDDTRNKLQQTTLMVNCLEASHYKINSSLCQFEGKSAPDSIFSQYIQTLRDKQGLLVSTLRLPLDMALEGCIDYSLGQPPNDYYQEVNLPEDEFINEEFPALTIIGHCRVLYDYDATQADELSIREGDIIGIYEKGGDWWEGELHGIRGIFPASYVKEC